jgi:nucleoside-diphosphate-sugar epimerase
MITHQNKVIVTGAGGFTGKYLVRELRRRGYNVVEIVRIKKNASQVACDITDAKALRNVISSVKPNYIIHLAGVSFVGFEDRSKFYDVNVFGTLNLLCAVRDLAPEIKKIILSSSANIYGEGKGKRENDLVIPVNHYAMSKFSMEKMAEIFFNELPIIVTRPFNYTGPGQDDNFLIPKIVQHFIRREKVIKLGNFNVSRDISDVRDVVSYYCELLKSNFHSGVINLCSGSSFSISEIILKMEVVSGRSILVDEDPSLKRDNEISFLEGSDEKLKNIIGFKRRFDIDMTLFDMYSLKR